MNNENGENIKFEFSMEQVNVILNALAQQPYVQVFELINDIHVQYKQSNTEK